MAQRFIRHEIGSQQEAIAALIASDDPWLRSCGAYAVGSLGILALEAELTRCLDDPDPLLREIARAARLRLQQADAKA